MSRKLVALVAAVTLIGTAPAAAPAIARPANAPLAVAAKSCTSGFKQARIGGQTKCLRRGQFCAHRYDGQYRNYGYRCTKRDARGNYHLT